MSTLFEVAPPIARVGPNGRCARSSLQRSVSLPTNARDRRAQLKGLQQPIPDLVQVDEIAWYETRSGGGWLIRSREGVNT